MWLRAISPRGEHHRHLRKYVEGELRPDICFYFRGPEGQLNLRAQNLAMFLHLTDGVDEATWRYHLRRHDYSRWFRDAIRDPSLAGEAERVESDRGIPSYLARQLIREMIQQRYTGTT